MFEGRHEFRKSVALIVQDARGNTDEILACRKNVHNALGGASASASTSGADAATFNLFLGAGLAVLLLARVW